MTPDSVRLDTLTPGRAPADGTNGHRRSRSALSLNERRWVLLFGDAVASLAAGFVGVYAWHRTSEIASQPLPPGRVIWVLILAGTWLFVAAVVGASGVKDAYVNLRPRVPVVVAASLHFALYLAWFFFSSSALPRVSVLVFEVAVVLAVVGWRRCWLWLGGREGFRRRVIIASTGETGRALGEFFDAHPQLGVEVVGFVEDPTSNGHREASVIASVAGIPDVSERLDVAEVIVDFRASPSRELMESVIKACERGVTITRACERLEALTGRVHVSDIGDDWAMSLPLDHRGTRPLYLAIKRGMDIAGGLAGMALLLVCVVPIAIAVRLETTGPVFFRQVRTGRGGTRFTVWKFRTMHVHNEDSSQGWVDNGFRPVTRVGGLLRRSHLDELPQFWNVLKGDMSLVGPRPVPAQDEHLGRDVIPFYGLRYAVKPGVSGWAAVQLKRIGDDDSAIRRLEYDLYYIKHQSLWLDLRVLTKALHEVAFLRGK